MNKTPGYKDSIEELESIVGEIENETVDIDVLAAKVKRATFLIHLCRKRLKKTDSEVKNVLKEFEKEDAEKDSELF
ncbi:MAG: exodeoxyribonuclease VII small subunit [Nitrospirota bacterium]